MKLALIGTHGVGKTTLAFETCSLFKKSGHNVELVTEVARQSHFPVNAATTLDAQLWILHAQIAAELDAGRRATNVICDRSALDNYCYLVNKFGRQAQLEPWLAWWMETYTLLIYVPAATANITADGFRSQDHAFQVQIEKILNDLLHCAPFQNVAKKVTRLSPSDRANWAQQIFESSLPHLETQKSAAT